jgi:signal transduction histidine kinase
LRRKTSQRNIFLFTGIGITGLMLFLFLYFRQKTVKNRIIAEQRIRQLEEEKKVLQAKALVEGQDEERKRIARELHDGLGVLLSTVKMQFTTLKDKSPENQPLIDRASQLLEQASTDVRKISHNMMPGLLTKLGLFEAVEDLMEKVGETEGLDVAVEVPEDVERLPENKEIMLYRIIQEMVNNTLKYAEAKKISVRLQMFPGKMEVYFSDDGKGFNVEEKLESKSIGLQSIQSRVNFLNGSLEIDSGPGKGTGYSITIPI